MHLNNLNNKLRWSALNWLNIEDKIGANILKLELWEKRLASGNVKSLQNLFLKMAPEILSKKDALPIRFRLQNLRKTFPDKTMEWNWDQFSVPLPIIFHERNLPDFRAYVLLENIDKIGTKIILYDQK